MAVTRCGNTSQKACAACERACVPVRACSAPCPRAYPRALPAGSTAHCPCPMHLAGLLLPRQCRDGDAGVQGRQPHHLRASVARCAQHGHPRFLGSTCRSRSSERACTTRVALPLGATCAACCCAQQVPHDGTQPSNAPPGPCTRARWPWRRTCPLSAGRAGCAAAAGPCPSCCWQASDVANEYDGLRAARHTSAGTWEVAPRAARALRNALPACCGGAPMGYTLAVLSAGLAEASPRARCTTILRGGPRRACPHCACAVCCS